MERLLIWVWNKWYILVILAFYCAFSGVFENAAGLMIQAYEHCFFAILFMIRASRLVGYPEWFRKEIK